MEVQFYQKYIFEVLIIDVIFLVTEAAISF